MKKKLLSLVSCILLILFLFFALPPDAFSRAGRGRSYRAPSRRSYSSTRRSSSRRSYSTRRTPSRYRSSTRRRSTRRYYPSTTRHHHHYYGGGRSGYRGGTCCGGCSLLFALPIIIFIIIIAVVISLVLKKNKNKNDDDFENASFVPMGEQYDDYPEDDFDDDFDEGPRALPPIDKEKVKEQLETLKTKDPNFSSKVFLDKMQTYFYEIQRAWTKGQLEDARTRMSEAQFTRMNYQLQELKDKGWVNKLEDIVIGGVKIAEAGVEGEYDSIKVRIHASMRDQTFDSKGKLVEGSKEIEPFAEYWTFIRKSGQKTNEDGGKTPSNKCPSCGAPMDSTDVSNCPYCGSLVSNASFDWVLDTITQSVEEEYM